jgi:hypothetical protein
MFTDWLSNIFLEIKSNIRFISNKTVVGDFKISPNYNLKFHDDFKSSYLVKWYDTDNYELPSYNTDMIQWYDTSLILMNKDGISFGASIKSKYFYEIDMTIPNADCFIQSKESWKYGIFLFFVRMNSCEYDYPTLCLSGLYNCTPEIDLFEGGLICILPNKITDEFIEYVIWWEKDFIKLYYNGYLVRKITDKRILDGMSEKQRIIIGTGVQEGFYQDNISPIIVNKVTVYQK